jgi:hypothetical protein
MTYEYFGYPPTPARYRENIAEAQGGRRRVAAKYIHKDQLRSWWSGRPRGPTAPLESFRKVTKLTSRSGLEGQGRPSPRHPNPSRGRRSREGGRGAGGSAAVDGVKSIRTVANSTMKGPMGEMNVKVVSTLRSPSPAPGSDDADGGDRQRPQRDDSYMSMASRGARPFRVARTDLLSIRRQAISLAQHSQRQGFQGPEPRIRDRGRRQLEALLVSFGGENEDLRDATAASSGRTTAPPGHGPADMVASYPIFDPHRTSSSLQVERP